MASALHEAIDCLEAIANRIVMKLPIPAPSKAKQGQHIVQSSRYFRPLNQKIAP